MADTVVKHRPFHCGSQAADWDDVNCGNCCKGCPPDGDYTDMVCDIQLAIGRAYFDDGSVSEDIAERMGYLDNSPPRAKGWVMLWQCKEFQPK